MRLERLDSETYRLLCRSRDFLASEYTQPLRLQDAAREACLSPYHYHRLFARTFGQTPHDFLTELRLDEAKRRLAKEELSVSEICFGLGYSSLGSFSARFHREFGCSPTEFRQNVRRFQAVSRVWSHRFVPTCFLRGVRSRG
jgi:AraC-like DNA-binding protein